MTDDPAPSLEQWKALYEAAAEFKKIKAWEWMYDSDIFGVQDPDTGETGYCSVMGALGELYALAVYLGAEGLNGYLKVQAGKSAPDDMIYTQKCLMASFESRKVLQSRDMKVIRELGLRFRGRSAWPEFRSYLPGYHPWYLTAPEAVFLTHALRQTREVALLVKAGKDLIYRPRKKGLYLVRVPRKDGKGLSWENEQQAPAPLPAKSDDDPSAGAIDEIRLQKIKKKNPARGEPVEIDFFYSPTPVQEGRERPVYPYVTLFVSHRSGLVLGTTISTGANYRSELRREFVELMERVGALPEEILVSKEEVRDVLKPFTDALKIKVVPVEKLEVLNRIRALMFSFLNR